MQPTRAEMIVIGTLLVGSLLPWLINYAVASQEPRVLALAALVFAFTLGALLARPQNHAVAPTVSVSPRCVMPRARK
jgi:hypothetical protein